MSIIRPKQDYALPEAARPPRAATRRLRRPTRSASRVEFLEMEHAVVDLVAGGATAVQSLAPLLDWLAAGGAADHAVLFLFNPEGRRVSMAAPSATPQLVRGALDALAVRAEDDPIGAAQRRREAIFVGNAQIERRWPSFAAAMAGLDLRAVWAYPVAGPGGGDVLGVLALFRRQAGLPPQAAKALIDRAAPLARLALEHDRRRLALYHADERFDALTASIPGVVYQRVVSPEGDIRYTYISEGARELFGVSPAEVLENPNNLFDCLGAEYRASLRDKLAAAGREMRIWDVEVPVIARDGKRKWTHARARPHRRADGSIEWNGLILDATQLKAANLALAAANRAKSEFLANMSHELRTPLNAVLGFAEMMREQVLGPIGNARYQQYAADIHQSGAHLLGIINDILDLAKVESGKLELNEEPLELARAVEASMLFLRERAERGRIALATRLAEPLIRLIADKRKLMQILSNLLSNAVKFTPEGGSVALEAGRDAAGDLVIAVRDSGIGIAPEQIPHLFEPFAQADSGLNRKFEGAGLGLPLTKAMVELHGGSVAIESAPRAGTVATVTLPARRILPAADPAAAAA
jgi:signal transduction histidine kinase